MPSQAELEKQIDEKFNYLKDAVKKGHASLAQAMLIPKRELEATYSTGLQLISMNKNEEAASVLSTLTIYEPYDIRFWRALGLALEKTKRPKLAIRCYDAALCLDERDLQTLTYRGEACLEAHRLDEARKNLEFVVSNAQTGEPALVPFVTRARGLLKYLNDLESV